MDLEYALLGLIRLHQGVTGYELNRMIKESTGNFLSASLSQIYPMLKKMHDSGLVLYRDVPIKNRPSKKVYLITKEGDKKLQAWLEEAIESGLDFKAFCLKMAFSPLMKKATILRHIGREIDYREGLRRERERGIFVEVEYLDKKKFDMARAEVLWNGIYQLAIQTEDLRLAWLSNWRQKVEKELKD
jgi:PadR family transcriptional regulator, regulatory protein AphA